MKDLLNRLIDQLKRGEKMQATTLPKTSKQNVTPEWIDTLQENEIFVFGCRNSGRHFDGASNFALENFGAIMGQREGRQGQSYAIPTIGGVIGLKEIRQSVKTFTQYATEHPELHFLVTPIGCGGGCRRLSEIAPMFRDATKLPNVSLPQEFWDILIPYSRMRDPQFAWLAETYTYEDASPQANMPYDRPEDSLRSGFDLMYGQYHIFHEWPDATTLMNYVKENLDMSYRLDPGKALIGSFATHDDISPMFHGGADYCKMTVGLQAMLPMLNMYQVDGFQTGDYYLYPWADKYNPVTQTDSHEMTVHHGKLDIFNLSRKPGGNDETIRTFMRAANKLWADNPDLLGRKGTFI